MRSILLFPRCLETIDVCIWHMFGFMSCSDCLGVCGNVCCVATVVNYSGVFSPLNVVVCLCLVCILCQFSMLHSA